MKGPKTIYVCRECGAQSLKWLGKCPECESWNTMNEEEFVEKPKNFKATKKTCFIENKFL